MKKKFLAYGLLVPAIALGGVAACGTPADTPSAHPQPSPGPTPEEPWGYDRTEEPEIAEADVVKFTLVNKSEPTVPDFADFWIEYEIKNQTQSEPMDYTVTYDLFDKKTGKRVAHDMFIELSVDPAQHVKNTTPVFGPDLKPRGDYRLVLDSVTRVKAWDAQ